MLRIENISKGKVPQKVWNKFHGNDIIDEIIDCYRSEGMFGAEFDYLLVMESTPKDNDIRCYGYVYNGNAPECSEFGSFGLSLGSGFRVW